MSHPCSRVDNKKYWFIQWLLAVILMTATDLANATVYNIPSSIGSGPFRACALVPGTTSTYSCIGSISIGNGDAITFAPNTILQVTGNFSVGNNSNISGSGVSISATGDINVGSSLFSSSVNFNAGGNFQTGGNAIMVGNISAGSNITIGNNNSITGNVNAGGQLSVGSGSRIMGTCTYQSSNYLCNGGPSTGGFTVTPSTATASSCAVAGGSPPAPYITITATNGAGGTVSTYTGTVTITGIGSGTLSVKTANGTLSGNRYTFASADNGVAVLYLSDPTAESVRPTVSDGSATGTSSSAITFSDNVLVISDADTLSPADQPVAGRTHALKAAVWSKDAQTCSINTKFSSTVNAKIWMTASASHPFGAAAPRVSTSNTCSGAVALPASAPGSANVSLAFSSGTAAFYLCTTDVGQYAVNITASSLPGSAAGQSTSNTLTVVPFAIVVSGVKQGSTSNPGTQTAAGTVFAKAGAAFQATVEAYRWSSAADADAAGFPLESAIFTSITSGATTPGYAQSVSLAVNTPIPAGGTTGSGLANGVVAVSGGAATVDTLSYPEVGSFALSATPVGKYLGQADLSSRVLIYSTTSPSPNNVVGRFTPDHFSTNVAPACATAAGGFTYSGQPFTVTITALNAAGVTTENYDAALGLANAVTLSSPTIAGTTPSPASVAASAFARGSAAVTVRLSMPAWTPATDMTLHAADGVITSTGNEAGAHFRIGRVRLMNASGSELLDLPMTMRVEYWNNTTTGWVLNTADTCTGDTSLSAENAVALSKTNSAQPTAALPAAAFNAMCAYDSGSLGASGIGCATPITPAKQFLKGGVAGFAGNFNLNFKAPGAGNTGTMTVTAKVPPWLQYPWSSPVAGNPTAKASFGKVKNSSVIFRREMY